MLSEFLTSLFTPILFSNRQSVPSALLFGFVDKISQSDSESTIALGEGTLIVSSNAAMAFFMILRLLLGKRTNFGFIFRSFFNL